MKLTNVSALKPVVHSGAGGVSANVPLPASAASVVAPDHVNVGALAGQVQAAQAQMASMPEIDAARVAEIKAALARGEIGFDPAKLAGLIVRHHGGR